MANQIDGVRNRKMTANQIDGEEPRQKKAREE
jgi:hypothetical protein